MRPFKALYGREPPSIPDYLATTTLDASLHVSLEQRQTVITQLK